jgi:hypothetical protein
MMKLKLFLLLFLSVLGIPKSFALDKVLGIIVELKSGQKVEFRLVDNPRFVHNGNTVVLSAVGVEIEYTPTDLLKVTTAMVDDISSGVDVVSSSEESIKVEGGLVRLCGFTPNDAVDVYSLSGMLITNYHINSDGSLVIPISSLPKDVSIIKANKQSIKITRR